MCTCPPTHLLTYPPTRPFRSAGQPDSHNRQTCSKGHSPIPVKYLQRAATPGVCASYADTLIAVSDALAADDIPIKHFLLDSWWYGEGWNGGAAYWEDIPQCTGTLTPSLTLLHIPLSPFPKFHPTHPDHPSPTQYPRQSSLPPDNAHPSPHPPGNSTRDLPRAFPADSFPSGLHSFRHAVGSDKVFSTHPPTQSINR